LLFFYSVPNSSMSYLFYVFFKLLFRLEHNPGWREVLDLARNSGVSKNGYRIYSRIYSCISQSLQWVGQLGSKIIYLHPKKIMSGFQASFGSHYWIGQNLTYFLTFFTYGLVVVHFYFWVWDRNPVIGYCQKLSKTCLETHFKFLQWSLDVLWHWILN